MSDAASPTPPVSTSTSDAELPTRVLLLEAMTLMIAADGVVADEELYELSRTVSEHPIFIDVDSAAVSAELRRALQALGRDGFEARLGVLAAGLTTYGTRLMAFAFATAICFADGVLADQELELLKAFQHHFGLRDEHVAEVISAIQEHGDARRVLEALMGETAQGTGRQMSREEALIEAMVLMAAADGEIQIPEVTQLALTVASDPRFSVLDEAAIGQVITTCLGRVQTHGVTSRLAELRLSLPSKEDRLQAIRFAMTILIADGVVDPGERRHLKHMQVAFELDPDEVVSLASQVEASRAR